MIAMAMARWIGMKVRPGFVVAVWFGLLLPGAFSRLACFSARYLSCIGIIEGYIHSADAVEADGGRHLQGDRVSCGGGRMALCDSNIHTYHSINNDGNIDFQEFELAIQRNQLQVNTRVAFM